MNKEEVIHAIKEMIRCNGIEEGGFNEIEKDIMQSALNLIEKQQKKIEYWKNGFERELENNKKNTSELLKQDLIIKQKKEEIEELKYNVINTNVFKENYVSKDKIRELLDMSNDILKSKLEELLEK